MQISGVCLSKKLLIEAKAIAAFKKAIMGTSIYRSIYRHAADYIRVTVLES